MSKYKTLKVFDCQTMPNKVRDHFIDSNNYRASKDCYLDFWVNNEEYAKVEGDIVSEWLIKNGAKAGEQVIIEYWW